MALRFPFRVKVSTSTTGAGSYTVTETPQLGYRTLSQAVIDHDLNGGDTVSYIVVDTTVTNNSTGKMLEVCTGVWDNTLKTLTRATVLQPNGTAVNWGAGQRDVLIIDNPLLYAAIANNLSELNAATARTNLGLGTAAVLNTGTGANNIPKCDGSGRIIGDGSQLTNLPQSIPGGGINKTNFYQAAAPVGWTQDTSHNDYMIGITDSNTGEGHPAGGTIGGIGWDATFGMTVAGHALTQSELPSGLSNSAALAAIVQATSITPAAPHTHGLSSALTWRPLTLNNILCSRN